jgi:hypothetical protein
VDASRERRSRRPARALIAVVVICSAGALAPVHGNAANAEEVPPNSADALIFWTACSQVTDLTDAELDLWKSRGVDGIACMHGRLRGMGGTQDFTGNAGASLAGSNYDFQRRLRDTNIVGRMRARGMKAYLGLKLVNYSNTATPLRGWFDDRGWSQVVLPKMADAAAAARLLGFAGVALDQELYPQRGGVKTASWDWNYPGNSHTEPEVRAKAKQRGQELMAALTGGFQGIELMAYDVRLPETWGELVQEKINGHPNAMAPSLHADFWDGLSSIEGYAAIRLMDATFYKSPHLGSWEAAFQYHYNRLYSYLSRKLSNWDYASSRFFVSPFSWIGPGPRGSEFDAARSPAHVATQLAAFRKWGMGREFANYAYDGLRDFDYSPYLSAMQAASAPGVVDAEPPVLVVDPVRPSSPAQRAALALVGTVTDNLAIRFVRWRNDRSGSGNAQLTWEVLSGDYRSAYRWRMRWSAPAIPLEPGQNRIAVTVEDIKGLTTTQVITVTNGEGTGATSEPELAPPPALVKVGRVSHPASGG